MRQLRRDRSARARPASLVGPHLLRPAPPPPVPARYLGSFDGNFAVAGRPIYPSEGDRIEASFASDADFRIPRMRIVGDAATDMIHGRCQPGGEYFVFANVGDDPGSAPYFIGTAGTDGTFRIEAEMNLRVGDGLDLTCRTAAGDQLLRAGETR